MNIVITGATRGIGRAIAEKFAQNHYNILAIARTGDDLQKMKEEFDSRFPDIETVTKCVDLADREQLEDLLQWMVESGYHAHVVVNNAALYVPSSITDEEDGLFEKMIHLNVSVPYKLTRCLLPQMIENGEGAIINICSVASIKPMAKVGSYGISKFALLGFTKHLREELKDKGIKVTAVIPGSTYTSSWDGSGIDKGRLVQAKDVAEMVFATTLMSASTVLEEILIRPQLGDL